MQFARFVSVPEVRSAERALDQFAAATLARREHPLLYLLGPPGSGKSHLVNRLLEQVAQGAVTVQVHAAAELGRALLSPPLDRRVIAKDALDCDVLIVEDLQHLPSGAGDHLSNILERRQRRRRPIMVTAVSGPAELQTSGRLSSRLAGGLVVGIEPLTLRSRRELAAALCRERGLDVDAAIIAWLSTNPGGVRPILGGIAQLESLSRRFPPPLTRTLVDRELPTPAEEHSPLERIVQLVARRFEVLPSELLGPSRLRTVTHARQVAMYVARCAGFSFPEIGRHFGGRDHSTAMHSCQKIQRALLNDLALSAELRELHSHLFSS